MAIATSLRCFNKRHLNLKDREILSERPISYLNQASSSYPNTLDTAVRRRAYRWIAEDHNITCHQHVTVSALIRARLQELNIGMQYRNERPTKTRTTQITTRRINQILRHLRDDIEAMICSRDPPDIVISPDICSSRSKIICCIFS